MHDTNLIAFEKDFYNVNWNSKNHFLEANLKYETLKGFSNQSKRLPGTMDK